MTQNDLDNGRLICLIGVAPTKPAEFVIFRIGQWTADAEDELGRSTCRLFATTRTARSTTSSRWAAPQGDGSAAASIGGFSDVSGLGYEVNYSRVPQRQREVQHRSQGPEHLQERRRHAQARARRLDRPLRLAQGVRDGADRAAERHDHAARRGAQAGRQPRCLRNAQPKKWTGPTLAAKGGGEVAMEELHLVHEGIEYE